MTEVTQHLGELIGQSDAEAASAQQATDAATAAATQTPVVTAPDLAQGITTATQPSALASTSSPITDAAHAASHIVSSGAPPAQYAFPFQSHEVFALLPHSIGAKAEAMWGVASQLTGDTSAFSIAVGGILLGAAAIAAVSTVRVWKRGEEFAVAGFGDRLTRSGTRYVVRQEAPVAAFADKHGVVRRAAAPTKTPEVAVAPPVSEPVAPAIEPSAPVPPAPKKDTWRDRREAQNKKTERKPAVPEKKPAEPVLVLPPESATAPAEQPEAKTENKPAKAPFIKSRNVKEPEPAPPLVAADETKRPKVVKRQLFKRSTATVNYAGAFHGSYGSFEQTDRLFARDYLKQTNEAFEAAYLKGKGPILPELKVSDNHRAERLFMMATRASFEDPQSALAALWQAVDEDRSDAVAWLRLAHFYLELGEFDHARRILEPLQAQAGKLDLDIIVAAAANSLAKISAQRGDVDAARKLFDTAIEHASKTDNPFMLGVASANAGLLEAVRKKYDAAKTLLQRGIKGFETCEERVSAARAKLALGIVHASLGDDDAAAAVWIEASETFRAAGFEDEAAQAQRWLKGEGTPNTVVL